MSLSYPIAETGLAALLEPKGFARTKSMAKREVDQLVEFETEWLRPNEAEAENWQAAIMTAVSTGAVQVYEGDKGARIVAISYWKLVEAPEILPEPEVSDAPAEKKPREDHADDLYFRHGRTKKSRTPEVDPNQFDLFNPAPKPGK